MVPERWAQAAQCHLTAIPNPASRGLSDRKDLDPTYKVYSLVEPEFTPGTH